MDFLAEITTPEYADRQSPGCAWHQDPECLCDVDRSKFICGDGPYIVPPVMEARFMDALEGPQGDGWFFAAFDQMWSDTMFRKGLKESVGDLANFFDRYPDETRALMDRTLTSAELHNTVAHWGGMLSDVVRVLGISPPAYGNKTEFAYPPIVRAECLRLYDEEGLGPKQIHAALLERGLDVKYHTIYGWIRRFATTWTGARPGRPTKEQVAA